MTIAVCWGAGWDSTAMLIRMAQMGVRPDVITFADTGGEKPGTYDFIPVFMEWLRDQDFPEPIVCRYEPKPNTVAKYKRATERVINDLNLSLSEDTVNRLGLLYGNMVANDTMPGIAFGQKSCSMKWKVEAQEFQ